MRSAKRLLLVEGERDQLFFSVLCSALGIDTVVKTPREFGQAFYNTKGGLFNLMPTLLKQLPDGQTERLAAVVDADHEVKFGLGCRGTIDRFAQLVRLHGFDLADRTYQDGGVRFVHDDGLSDIGLWIMPDNEGDGIFEDWMCQCIPESENELYGHAKNTVSDLTAPKFRQIHFSKAVIATWLAWQANPGQGPHKALSEGLIDRSCGAFQNLESWLKSVFC